MGLVANSDYNATTAVIMVSVFGPILLWILSMLGYFLGGDDSEQHVWVWAIGISYWICLIITMAVAIQATVSAEGAGTLRDWHRLKYGNSISGGTELFNATNLNGYRYYDFSTGAFFPGSEGTAPSPIGEASFTCGDGLRKTVCVTPMVGPDYEFGDPITVWASCSSSCGPQYYSCLDLLTGDSPRDCIKQWRATANYAPFLAYRHLHYWQQRGWAATATGFQMAPDSVFIRISSPQHVESKINDYYKRFITVHATLWGVGFGCCLFIFLFAFIMALMC